MVVHQWPRQLRREWLVALASYALVVAPFGCQFQADLLSSTGTSTTTPLDTASAGLFLNQDTTSPLIVAGRNTPGDAFFVYGTHNAGGGVGEITSILIKTTSGQQSYILFESGRPTHLQAVDGSYVHVTYDGISTSRLAVTAKVHDATTGATETHSVDVNLQATAAQVAQTIQDLTGQPLAVPIAPAVDSGKLQHRSLGPLLSALVMIPMLLVTELMIVIMGQVMVAVFAAVTAVMQVAVMAAFAPLFLFAGLMNDVTVRIDMVPLANIFIDLPAPPSLDIVIQ
jgi:hypothetical protein